MKHKKEWHLLDFGVGRDRLTCMERSPATLFAGRWDTDSRRPPIFFDRKTRTIGVVFLPIYLPILVVGAVISVPWTYVQRAIDRRSERKFAAAMASMGRSMPWSEFQPEIDDRRGTVIREVLSTKGPSRWWWTAEDVTANSPHKCAPNDKSAWLDPEFRLFSRWCKERYTHAASGTACLVVVPDAERKRFLKRLPDLHFVSIAG